MLTVHVEFRQTTLELASMVGMTMTGATREGVGEIPDPGGEREGEKVGKLLRILGLEPQIKFQRRGSVDYVDKKVEILYHNKF